MSIRKLFTTAFVAIVATAISTAAAPVVNEDDWSLEALCLENSEENCWDEGGQYGNLTCNGGTGQFTVCAAMAGPPGPNQEWVDCSISCDGSPYTDVSCDPLNSPE